MGFTAAAGFSPQQQSSEHATEAERPGSLNRKSNHN
jgi:hypothetical protein